jgi:hypothetical protein
MESCLPAIYRSADPIDNLLIRVTLQKRSAPGDAPHANVNAAQPGSGAHTQGNAAPVVTGVSILQAANAGLGSSSTLGGGGVGASGGPAGTIVVRSISDDRSMYTVDIPWQHKVYGPRYVAVLGEEVRGEACARARLRES